MSALPQHGEKALSTIEEALSSLGPHECVQFWWRDDDANASSDALLRLLSLSEEQGAPVALAVITGQLKPSLAVSLQGHDTQVLVHGWRHKNHAAAGEPKSEYPASRPRDEMREELAKGLDALRNALPQQAVAVFVPPWNRFAPGVEDDLVACGYIGLSSSRAMPAFLPEAVPLRRADVDLNLVTTAGASHLADLGNSATALARRIRAGERGPFGVVTHHRLHDEDVWSFCSAFWRAIRNSAHAEAIDARAVFCP